MLHYKFKLNLVCLKIRPSHSVNQWFSKLGSADPSGVLGGVQGGPHQNIFIQNHNDYFYLHYLILYNIIILYLAIKKIADVQAHTSCCAAVLFEKY